MDRHGSRRSRRRARLRRVQHYGLRVACRRGTVAGLGVVTLSGLIRLEARLVLAGVRHETIPAYAIHHATRHRQCYDPQSCGSPFRKRVLKGRPSTWACPLLLSRIWPFAGESRRRWGASGAAGRSASQNSILKPYPDWVRGRMSSGRDWVAQRTGQGPAQRRPARDAVRPRMRRDGRRAAYTWHVAAGSVLVVVDLDSNG